MWHYDNKCQIHVVIAVLDFLKACNYGTTNAPRFLMMKLEHYNVSSKVGGWIAKSFHNYTYITGMWTERHHHGSQSACLG